VARWSAENPGMQIPQSNPASLPVQAPVSTRGAAPSSAVPALRGASSVGVDAAVSSGQEAPATPETLVARLDAYGAGLAQNIGEALAALPGGARDAAQGTLGHFEHNLGRIRAGIEDGSLRGDGLARAMQGALANVRFDLARVSQAGQGQAGPDEVGAAEAGASAGAEAASVAASAGTDVARTGATAQGRFQNIVAGINQRLAGLGSESQSGERAAELQAAQESFASAASRIETAFFERGEFDRGTFYGLLSASIGRLQQRVTDLQSGTQAQDATLYDSKRGVESLSEGLRKVRFDRTV
jgi:hypothetical protein